jgi:hypothetical protein
MSFTRIIKGVYILGHIAGKKIRRKIKRFGRPVETA